MFPKLLGAKRVTNKDNGLIKTNIYLNDYSFQSWQQHSGFGNQTPTS